MAAYRKIWLQAQLTHIRLQEGTPLDELLQGAQIAVLLHTGHAEITGLLFGVMSHVRKYLPFTLLPAHCLPFLRVNSNGDRCTQILDELQQLHSVSNSTAYTGTRLTIQMTRFVGPAGRQRRQWHHAQQL